jgi:hypothetical protein
MDGDGDRPRSAAGPPLAPRPQVHAPRITATACRYSPAARSRNAPTLAAPAKLAVTERCCSKARRAERFGGTLSAVKPSLLGVTCAAWILLAGGAASAEDRAGRSHSGFAPSIAVGVGGFARQLRFEGTPDWAPGRRTPAGAVHIQLAYRFGPPLDLGLHIAHQWLGQEGLDAQSSAFATASSAGILARLHPLTMLWPSSPLDLSLGVGFDFFASARQTTTTDVAGMSVESRQAVPGFALPLWLGLDLLLGLASVGVAAIYAPWWSSEVCTGVGTGLPACEKRSAPPEHYFFLGISLGLNLEFVG